MYVAKELHGKSEQRFTSRDQLLSFLEQENARLRANQQQTIYSLSQVNALDQQLQKTRIELPFEETVEERLESFGLIQEGGQGKRGLLSVLGKKPTGPEQAEGTTQAGEQTVPSMKLMKLILPVLVLVGALGLYTFVVAGQTKKLHQEIRGLNNQVETLTNLQEASNKIDVFSRYFLAAFYSNNKEAVEQYITDELKEDIDVKEGSLHSAVPETVQAKGKDYEVTYVLYVNQNEDKRIVRLRFTVKADKDSRYGYLVTSQPTESLYPG